MRDWRHSWQSEGRLDKNFDAGFLTRADATNPQQVGIWGALKGSILTMIVTLVLAFPIGVLAALYLEEYAPKNRWTDLIEVSINNLAAVPSIIFGLLGLAVFLTHLPELSLRPAHRRHDAGADDHAGHRDFRAQCDQGRAAHRSATARWPSALRLCRWCSTTSCRSPCPAF